jgi:hypothetical protein
MRAAIFPPHWQSVEHDCRECAGHRALKENVARSDGKGALAMTGSKRCSKSECIEMTAMIRNEHERPVRGQFLPARYRESVRDREISSQQRKASVMREAFEQAALAPYAAEPFSWC